MLLKFMSLPMLEEDDGLNIGGTGEEEQEVAEPVNEEGGEEQEVAEPVSKSDSAFAELRRRAEEAERKVNELEARNAEYDETLGLFFDGDNKIAQARAYHDEVPVEQVVANMQAAREREEMQSQNESLKAENDLLRYNQMKAQDLAELKEHGITDIADVEELGEDFFRYRANGLSASEAYDFIQMRKPKPPKSMGKVEPSPTEKDFFTRDEVMAMSSAERFKHIDKITASMKKWPV